MDWKSQFDREITAALPGLRVLRGEPMRRHTSFRTGGPAARMAFPKDRETLAVLLSIASGSGARPFIMGSGTNLLAPDAGVDRLIVNTREMCRVEDGETAHTFYAEAGCSLRRAAEYACSRGLTGLEFAHGIPGSVGGGVCMNAGAYGGEMSQVLAGAGILFPSEEPRFFSKEELNLSYRHSLLTERPDGVILYALFRLTPGDPETIRETMRTLMERRKTTQPLDFPSAGSTFKRPPGYYAGTLIDQCGLKGLRVGGAEVSRKHAGFVINSGDATSTDILALIREVQRRVYEQTGVTLEPEVRILE